LFCFAIQTSKRKQLSKNRDGNVKPLHGRPRFKLKNRGKEAFLVLIRVTYFCLVPLESPTVLYCGVYEQGQNAGLGYAN
jgi:hypothetical protein